MARYQFDHYRFDNSDGNLCHRPSGNRVVLRPQVARLLEEFLTHPGEVLSRESLYLAIWGEGAVVDFESGLSAVVKELRHILDAGGDAELVETVPRRGYRFRASHVRQLRGNGLRLPQRPGSILVAVAVMLVLAGILTTWWMPGAPEPDAAAPESVSLAILPFERFGDEDRLPPHVEYLLPDGLLARLWQAELSGLELVGRTSLQPYAGREDIHFAVASDLGVDLLIEGSAVAREDGWRVEARMLMVPGGRVVWSESIRGPEDQPLDPSAAAGILVDQLVGQWPGIRARLAGDAVSE